MRRDPPEAGTLPTEVCNQGLGETPRRLPVRRMAEAPPGQLIAIRDRRAAVQRCRRRHHRVVVAAQHQRRRGDAAELVAEVVVEQARGGFAPDMGRHRRLSPIIVCRSLGHLPAPACCAGTPRRTSGDRILSAARSRPLEVLELGIGSERAKAPTSTSPRTSCGSIDRQPHRVGATHRMTDDDRRAMPITSMNRAASAAKSRVR